MDPWLYILCSIIVFNLLNFKRLPVAFNLPVTLCLYKIQEKHWERENTHSLMLNSVLRISLRHVLSELSTITHPS